MSSLILNKAHFKKRDYDFWIKSDVIGFKSFELIMLSFYDFLDDKDCLNTSLFLYFERFLWTILEMLFDLYELHIKTLCIIQLIFSIIFLFFLFFCCYFMTKDIMQRMNEEQQKQMNKENEQIQSQLNN